MAISDWMELRNVLLWSVSIGSSWEQKGQEGFLYVQDVSRLVGTMGGAVRDEDANVD